MLDLYREFGDFTLGYFYGIAWAERAQELEGSPLQGEQRALLNDCYTGAWVRDITPDDCRRHAAPAAIATATGADDAIASSPGDLDEAIRMAILVRRRRRQRQRSAARSRRSRASAPACWAASTPAGRASGCSRPGRLSRRPESERGAGVDVDVVVGTAVVVSALVVVTGAAVVVAPAVVAGATVVVVVVVVVVVDVVVVVALGSG